jgi:adenylyl- and sulfurtransferase ThiI
LTKESRKIGTKLVPEKNDEDSHVTPQPPEKKTLQQIIELRKQVLELHKELLREYKEA